MPLPMSTVPPAGFLMVFLVLVGFVAGLFASWISFYVAEKTGYGVVTVPATPVDDVRTGERGSIDDLFESQTLAGTLVGGVFAVVLVVTLQIFEQWSLNGVDPDFVLRSAALVAMVIVGAGWILARRAVARRRTAERGAEGRPRPVSALLLDIGVFLVSLVVLLPLLALLLFIGLVT